MSRSRWNGQEFIEVKTNFDAILRAELEYEI